MEKIKFEVKKIGKEPYVVIVGMAPGKQRKGEKTRVVWEGNRSSDLLNEAIKDKDNLFLTNVFNYYVIGELSKKLIEQGIEELKKDLSKIKVKKIICLGNLAYNEVQKLQLKNINIIKLQHPSYIIRFNKDKTQYLKQLENEIK